jgi:hypothetical protein
MQASVEKKQGLFCLLERKETEAGNHSVAPIIGIHQVKKYFIEM